MAEEKEVWKFDVSELTLDDLIALEEVGRGTSSRELRALIARFVIDKDEKEIGALTMSELRQTVVRLREAIEEEIEIPKESMAD